MKVKKIRKVQVGETELDEGTALTCPVGAACPVHGSTSGLQALSTNFHQLLLVSPLETESYNCDLHFSYVGIWGVSP